MPELRSEFLLRFRLELADSFPLGETPAGQRKIDIFSGGHFEGPKLKGEILPGGSDTLLQGSDGAFRPDVRMTFRTDDEAIIQVSYRGVRHGSAEVTARIAAGEYVPPTDYYLRTALSFETAAEKYHWLNRIVAVGVGERVPGAAEYDVFEIL